MANGSTNRRFFLGSAVAVGLGAAVAARIPRQRPARATQASTTVAGDLAVITCAGWGAREPSAPVPVLAHRPTMIIVHHTGTANSLDTSRAHAVATARGIQKLHMDTNKWLDTGQHFTITRGGWVLEGRHGSLDQVRAGRSMVQGTHCVGQNDVSIGIECEGTYTSVQPPDALWHRLVQLSAYICRRYRLLPTEIYGHNDFNATLCPGQLRGRLPELRTSVAAAI